MLKRNLIGIPNISNYMTTINDIQCKIFENTPRDPLANHAFKFEEIKSENNYSENRDIYELESELDFVVKNPEGNTQNDFCLIKHILFEQQQKPFLSEEQLNNLKKFEEYTKYQYSNDQRKRAIQKYREKKMSRKNSNFVRYKIRKDLAEKRKRHKGKFIKKKKINLKKAFDDYIENKIINKDMDKLKI